MPQPQLETLDHLVLTVGDINRTTAFYGDVLGMRAEQFETAGGERRWALNYGRMKINLHQAGREFEPKAAFPTPGSADLCFLTRSPLAEWERHLNAHSVTIEEGPVQRSGAMGPITSLYIRDPDGNLIEIAVEDATS